MRHLQIVGFAPVHNPVFVIEQTVVVIGAVFSAECAVLCPLRNRHETPLDPLHEKMTSSTKL